MKCYVNACFAVFFVLAHTATLPAQEPDITADDDVTSVTGMVLRLVETGDFQMGGYQEPKSEPQHKVRISKPFFLGAYEVTQAEFKLVMGRNPSVFARSNRPAGDSSDITLYKKDTSRFPVENVSWFDAIEFCNKLSEKDKLVPFYRLSAVDRNADGSIKEATVRVVGGEGYRLPTEAQWEYACRAGTRDPYYYGERPDRERARVLDEPHNPDHPAVVGSYKRNPWRLYDMYGNVSEWCWDCYDRYSEDPAVDPSGPRASDWRVQRGGSWHDFSESANSLRRDFAEPGSRSDKVGFRVARNVSAPK